MEALPPNTFTRLAIDKIVSRQLLTRAFSPIGVLGIGLAKSLRVMWKAQSDAATSANFARKSPESALPDADSASGACPTPTCLHCGNALDLGSRKPFCCAGCETVYDALTEGGLLDYYSLRDVSAQPVGDLRLERRDHKWMLPHERALEQRSDRYDTRFQIQGLQCAACVWLIEQIFYRQPGALAVEVNSGAGVLALSIAKPFDLPRFVREVERLGYLLGDFDAERNDDVRNAADTLMLRATIASALAANAMMFSLATYLGLGPGPLRSFLHSVNFGLSILTVLIGAPVFISAALRSLRSGVLHLDLPIALGILLTSAAATWSFITGIDQAAYYDSLAVFIALMLWGRYLQDRVVLRNRNQLLALAADGGLVCRRLVDQRVEDVAAAAIAKGDRLILPPGDIAPVLLQVVGESATCSLDWITGEPEPSVFAPGQILPAGAVNVGENALVGISQEAYEDSQIKALLAVPIMRKSSKPAFASRFAHGYVVLVLAAAIVGFLRGIMSTGQSSVGLQIATAVCVVSCPCSIGLALPLAQEIISTKLRKLGLFVRDASFLQRAADINRIAFDKTGTLTTGQLQLENPQQLARLGSDDRRALYTMAVSSGHPHARAIRRCISELCAEDAVLLDASSTREKPGYGIELDINGIHYRLGRANWAGGNDEAHAERFATLFAREGLILASFRMNEVLRPSAERECQRLSEAQIALYVVSGDARERVEELAAQLGIDRDHAFFEQSPADKAKLMKSRVHQRTLMLGDGINDNLALEAAYASGTPSLDRPAVTTRADFYYVTPGLSPIRAAIFAARDLRSMTHRAWYFFGIYNALAVAAAILGIIQPWTAAVIMPASSIASVIYVAVNLEQRSPQWTS